MFRITDGKGFHITFENGFTSSIQWGTGNYCDNRDFISDYSEKTESMAGAKGSADAEVAASSPQGHLIPLKAFFPGCSNTIQGWVKPDKIPSFLAWVSSL